MRILLINPPPFYHPSKTRYLERGVIQSYTMPLGLGYIAGYIEKHGYEVSILDAYIKNMSYEDIGKFIETNKPDVIGVTCLSDQRGAWYRLIELIREINSSIRIVLGGPHPSLLPHQVLTAFKPDAIIIGEGEETMLELLRCWEAGDDIRKVKGIAYIVGNDVVLTDARQRIKDLDSLPFPARHLVSLDDYQGWDFMAFLSDKLSLVKPPRYATISTSRGCIGKCGYCSSPLIWKAGWTYRSAKNIADEMEMLVRDYGIEFVIMTDDIFTVNQSRVIDLCREIVKRRLDVLWGFETAVNMVSSELLNSAREAGCCCILYGVESGATEILSVVSKRIKRQDVLNAFRETKEAGILAGAFLMVGNPGESERTVNDTIELLREIKPDIILPQIAMVTPKTKMYEIAKERGFIDEQFWLSDYPFPYYTAENSLKTLLRWHRKLSYYKHSNFGIGIRSLRNAIEFQTGFRFTKKGITITERVP